MFQRHRRLINIMNQYKLILSADFQKYRVRRVRQSVKMILAFILISGEEEYVSNIMYAWDDTKDIIKRIKLCKKMNDDFLKKKKEN